MIQDVSPCFSNAEFSSWSSKKEIMEVRGALHHFSEEEPLLLPLPHEWASVPWTVEDSSIPSTLELGGTNFQLANLGFCN